MSKNNTCCFYCSPVPKISVLMSPPLRQRNSMKSGETSYSTARRPGSSTTSRFLRPPRTERRRPSYPSRGPSQMRRILFPKERAESSSGVWNLGVSVAPAACMKRAMSASATVIGWRYAPPLTKRYWRVSVLSMTGSSSVREPRAKSRSCTTGV